MIGWKKYGLGGFAGIVLSVSAQAAWHTAGPIRNDPLPLPLSAAVIDGPDAEANRLALSILNIVTSDLERTTAFTLASPVIVGKARRSDSDPPDFHTLGKVAELVEARIEPNDNRQRRIRVWLWDVFGRTQMLADTIPFDAADWRRTAHLIAGTIYQRTKGSPVRLDEPVFFATLADKANPRLVVMDWDGWNPRYLTDKHEDAFPPRVGTDGAVFSLVRSGHTQHLFRFEPDGRRVVLPGDFSSVTGTPSPSPDGQAIVFSRSDGGRANLYRQDLRTREEIRLSNGAWTETDPSYAPDGQGIAFVSNRGGTPQLYVMNPDGSAPHRVSFGAGRYLSVAWSSTARLLALVKAVPDAASGDKPAHEHFVVEVMHVDGSGERWLGDFPAMPNLSWTSDSRALFAAGGTAPSNDRKAALTMFYFVDLAYFYAHRKDFWVDLSGTAAPR